MGGDTRDKPEKDGEKSHHAAKVIDGGQSPPHPLDKTHPKPEVHWGGVPDTMCGDVDDLLEEYKALWAGMLGKVDVTPHRIEVTPGPRPRRAQPHL